LGLDDDGAGEEEKRDDPNVVDVHDVTWTKGLIAAEQASYAHYYLRTQINFGDNVDLSTKTELDYFLLMYPLQNLESCLAMTNRKLPRHERPVSRKEFFKYVGIRLHQSYSSADIARDMWAVEADADSLVMPMRMGALSGMSRHR
jgi:hypothetical protein